MADDKTTGRAPVKATMAPAARDPEGAGKPVNERASRVDSLMGMSDREFEQLASDVSEARRRRATRPLAPSFGMSEGERTELEQHGETTSPWTGERIEGDGSPRTKA
jgi:hypothetical protein